MIWLRIESTMMWHSSLSGLKLSFVMHPARTILVAKVSALAPWSWHDGSRKLQFADAKSVVSFVDGHVHYIKIYFIPKDSFESDLCMYFRDDFPSLYP